MAQVEADAFLATDENLIPNEVVNVKDTPFDFRVAKKIGADIWDENTQINIANGGYDHTFIINGEPGILRHAATLKNDVSGISMDVLTTLSGMQLYTGNFLDGSTIGMTNIYGFIYGVHPIYSSYPAGKNATVYTKHGAVCLETQHFPDAPNQFRDLAGVFLNRGQEHRSTTVYRFSNVNDAENTAIP